MRCFPCHTPHEIDKSNPRHQAAIKTQKKMAEQYSPDMLARLRLFKKTPEATMDFLVQRSLEAKQNEIPILDLKHPTRSLLLLKPLSKLPAKKADGTFEKPSSLIPTTHMGGLKMHKNDQSYKSFVAWIQDYAKVTEDRYASVDELPADNWHATKNILRVTAAPKSWPVGTPVQLFVHSWNAQEEQWSEKPIAFTQGTVTPRRIINGALFLLGNGTDDGTEAPPALARGNYQIRVFVDLKERLKKDPALLLNADSFVGQAILRNARWREGFRAAETVSAQSIRK
jgi:hypothetical protein